MKTHQTDLYTYNSALICLYYSLAASNWIHLSSVVASPALRSQGGRCSQSLLGEGGATPWTSGQFTICNLHSHPRPTYSVNVGGENMQAPKGLRPGSGSPQEAVLTTAATWSSVVKTNISHVYYGCRVDRVLETFPKR